MGNNFYSRQNTSAGEPTQVAGLGESKAQPAENEHTSNVNSQKGPVVGFLYSISRHGFGEFWPIHTGQNIIGRSEKCDIRLPEKSVSGVHADIRARILKRSGEVIANIKDMGSKNGIEVNEQELRYDEFNLKDGDKILIGDAYELLFILIDPKAKGLKVAENFCEADESIDDDPFGYSSDSQNYQPTDSTHGMYDHSNRNTQGTINLDSSSNIDSGHTTIL